MKKSQRRTIEVAEKTAATLARRYPEEMAIRYRTGYSQDALAFLYLPGLYQDKKTRETARTIISKTLRNVMGADELKDIASERHRKAGKKVGASHRTVGTGIFGYMKTYETVRFVPLYGEKMSEDEFISRRAADLRGTGMFWEQVAGEANALYKHHRTAGALRSVMSYWKNRSGEPMNTQTRYTDVANTDHGPLSERDYITRLKKNSFPWKEIAERANTYFHHDREWKQLCRSYYVWEHNQQAPISSAQS